jgi:hypothetical protein
MNFFWVVLAVVVIFIVGFIGLVLMPAITIGLVIGVVFLAVFFSIRKYYMTRKFIYGTVPFLILFLFGYFSVVFLSPISGTVLDAVTGAPIGDIQVTRSVRAIPMVLNLGGPSSYEKWREDIKTDSTGRYVFSRAVYFINPLTEIIWEVEINIPVWSTTEREFKSDMERIGGEEKYLKGLAVSEYANKKFEESYSSKPFMFDTRKNEFLGPHPNEIGGSYDHGRINFFPKRLDIYLIPEVDDISKCDKVIKKELRSKCLLFNAERLAIQFGHAEYCQHAMEEADCIINVAKKQKDKDICDKLLNLSREKSVNGGNEYLKNSCLRGVATEKLDVNICNSIPESEWISVETFSDTDRKKIVSLRCQKKKL